MLMVLSADPVASMNSDVGLNESELMASEWPSSAFCPESDCLVSTICSVRSSETVPTRCGILGLNCTSLTMAVWCVNVDVACRALLELE